MKRTLPCLFVALVLAGCAATPTRTATTSEAKPAVAEPSAPSNPPSSVPQEALPPVTVTPPFIATPVPPPEPPPVMSGNRAVLALLERAQQDNMGGKREAAGLSLERALRIEPRNPWLWHELAQLRLSEGQYAQAITLARKSTSFAGQDKRLKAANWKVIGDAYVGLGESAQAEQAYKQGEALQPAAIVPAF